METILIVDSNFPSKNTPNYLVPYSSMKDLLLFSASYDWIDSFFGCGLLVLDIRNIILDFTVSLSSDINRPKTELNGEKK